MSPKREIKIIKTRILSTPDLNKHANLQVWPTRIYIRLALEATGDPGNGKWQRP
jgi:hypothetical protein